MAITELKSAWCPSARSSLRRLSPKAVSEMASKTMASANQRKSRLPSADSDSPSVCRLATTTQIIAPAARIATTMRSQRRRRAARAPDGPAPAACVSDGPAPAACAGDDSAGVGSAEDGSAGAGCAGTGPPGAGVARPARPSSGAGPVSRSPTAGPVEMLVNHGCHPRQAVGPPWVWVCCPHAHCPGCRRPGGPRQPPGVDPLVLVTHTQGVDTWALRWLDPPDGPAVALLDQTRLPAEEAYLTCTDVASLVDAIGRLVVRGAPLLGLAGAFGVALAAY